MFQSSAVPAELKQRFANSLYNAAIGEVLTDPKGRLVEKKSFSQVQVSGMTTTIEAYLGTYSIDPEAGKGRE